MKKLPHSVFGVFSVEVHLKGASKVVRIFFFWTDLKSLSSSVKGPKEMFYVGGVWRAEFFMETYVI